MQQMEHKSYPVRVKAASEDGTFEAIVSVFGNVDSVGDVMERGSFARSIEERGLPHLYWNHDWDAGPVGETLEARETDEGLLIKARLFLEADDPYVRRVHAALKSGNRSEFSFAFIPKAWEHEDRDGHRVRKLTDVELFEVSAVVLGANPATRLVSVRSARAIPTADEPTVLAVAEAVVAALKSWLHPTDAAVPEDDPQQDAAAERDASLRVPLEDVARALWR